MEKNMEQNKKTIGILTFEKYHGRRDVGSSRIRGHWLIKYWDEAELFKPGKKYKVCLYQKAYFVEHAKAFSGIKILDLCDPEFLHWSYRTKQMLKEVDAVTTSTESLAEAIRKFTDKPVVYIPDRVDLEFHKETRRLHQGRAKWVVWFGYSAGFDMIKPVLHFLKKHNLNLIVISNKLFNLPASYYDHIELKNLPWKLETVNEDIVSADIVINPQSKKGKWKYKSNNKTITAWALGMPVANDVEELEKFLDGEERQKESQKKLQEVKELYDVKISVNEYQELISKIAKEKYATSGSD